MAEIVYQKEPLYPKILWQRPVHFYKNKAGKILIIAGSANMTGSAILVCEAAFRSGTGLLILGFPESLKEIYREILPEAMTLRLPETPSKSLAQSALEQILETAKSCDVAIIGPGLSLNDETMRLVWNLLRDLDMPIVLDGDGLSALIIGIETIKKDPANDKLDAVFSQLGKKLVLTPHSNEAYRLFKAIRSTDIELKKLNPTIIEADKQKYAQILANQLKTTIVLKGFDSVICNGMRIVVNKVGGPELASAGTGDVLSGIIGSFIGQNPQNRFEAICTAVYLHGLSAKIAKEKLGERSLIASDIIRYLPEAISKAEDKIK